MDEKESLGKYIQQRLRERGIEDKAVADILNLSVKTVPKIYKQSEIPSDRIAKISILLNENVYLHYYGSKEPLKSILNQNTQELEQKVSKLEALIEQHTKTIDDKDHIIELQNKLIAELEEKLSKDNS
ncbi:hypothetical protein [Sphingobacterium sp. CZ-2]|uniref:hypothetical protein n=1 Tax=Sphingobacterium sp. CZ-2 TaxID=2557994 RepID=UPI00106F0BE4|nr:hypothetical protein [Sphingobacterium sp. CZ-2]QBR11585.1 hypothetical protein E3D81_05120 [Sphingobacterium sp. CZ-2]